MSYQVLARKWRPQRFDDVLGQPAVTRTLTNALKTNRIAQAFVFAGPRGSGKTTTARLLARALNCVNGPTAAPCGVCEACVEIAEGRDIDVLEIDAATHTGVDNVREVIIEGLAITPVRNRYKVFLIDEVHMLSTSSFNALLKSLEEPPPHVIFMMATTDVSKILPTVLSRSQVYEFRTISSRTIADRLRHIADAESIQIPDAAIALLARAGEGSMRDALSAFDQVRAFAGDDIQPEDVVTVLGLVGRDLVFDMLEAVAAEDAAAAFALVERGIERGYDLRQLCRELARATRDLLIVKVDPSRAADPEIAAEGERERMKKLAEQSSREDLLRAFDLLTKAEEEIKESDQPRYNMEMALLRLMHLRQLVPIAELLTGSGSQALSGSKPASRPVPTPTGRVAPVAPAAREAPAAPAAPAARVAPATREAPAAPASNLKDAFLAQVKASKGFFYNTVVASAYSVDVTPARITFTFQPNQRVPRQQCDEQRVWLEEVAEKVAGKRIPVTVVTTNGDAAAPPPPAAARPATPAPDTSKSSEEDLRKEAMADPTVQALFEIFPVEKSKIEEI
jgi:DNA polymerase III subunit gamma/tau